MKTDLRDGGGRDDPVEVAVDVPGFDRRPDPSGEDQPGLLPPFPCLFALRRLEHTMTGQHAQQG